MHALTMKWATGNLGVRTPRDFLAPKFEPWEVIAYEADQYHTSQLLTCTKSLLSRLNARRTQNPKTIGHDLMEIPASMLIAPEPVVLIQEVLFQPGYEVVNLLHVWRNDPFLNVRLTEEIQDDASKLMGSLFRD